VLLAWARDRDGAKVQAARLDPAARRARAPFTCLGCGEPLVPRLGRIRARHFAHRPGSSCPLTAPETALHLDAKERLLALCRDAFAGARRVTLLARCPACRRPAPRDLRDLGDAAAGEGAVGPLRADVLVLSAGAPALVLEVKVTHAVEPEKEAALAAAGVPALEIDAWEEWERVAGEGAASPGLPGAGERRGSRRRLPRSERGVRGDAVSPRPPGKEPVEIVPARSLGFPPCPACLALARADADRALGGEAAEIAELEAYRARGLLGPAPGAPRAIPAGSGAAGAGGAAAAPPDAPDRPLSAADRAELGARFRCPECGSRDLLFGERIARHACPGGAARPVAWRGYDGSVVSLAWWRSATGRRTT